MKSVAFLIAVVLFVTLASADSLRHGSGKDRPRVVHVPYHPYYGGRYRDDEHGRWDSWRDDENGRWKKDDKHVHKKERPRTVGSICRAHHECDMRGRYRNERGSSLFCEKSIGRCSSSHIGFCRIRPQACQAIYKPVCGCNGRTYSNECIARSAGENIHSQGPCRSSRPDSGCRNNEDCLQGQYCMKNSCEISQVGQCERRPEQCTFQYLPVCGCDGVTHTNKCVAQSNGANVAHNGVCGSREPTSAVRAI